VVEWLTLLLRVLELSGSNLGPETGYPDIFRVFAQFLQKNSVVKLKLDHDHFHHIYFNLSFTYCLQFDAVSSLVYEKASLNKLLLPLLLEVRTEFLNIIYRSFGFKGLKSILILSSYVLLIFGNVLVCSCLQTTMLCLYFI
jgi:hypothetical protein